MNLLIDCMKLQGTACSCKKLEAGTTSSVREPSLVWPFHGIPYLLSRAHPGEMNTFVLGAPAVWKAFPSVFLWFKSCLGPVATCTKALKRCQEMMDFDVRSLVTYDQDAAGDGPQEVLSELVPSQWGLVHLFDLCLWFGYVDTALALATSGVTGCRLEDHHLKILKALPDARGAEPDYFSGPCRCSGWETCSLCCWGFPLDNGIWMKDWEAVLEDAAAAAKRPAQMPIVRYILDACSSNETLPFAMSKAWAARMLDIAILRGNVEAATNLARTCQARPLRRWRGHEMPPKVSTAALLAGANFQGLHMEWFGADVPLLQLLALDFGPDRWRQLEHWFRKGNELWPTTCDVGGVGDLFLSVDDHLQHYVSMLKIKNALRAGWDLKYLWIALRSPGGSFTSGLLDLAILCGQSDCACVLALAGVELNVGCLDLCRQACHGGEILRGVHVNRDCGYWEGVELRHVGSPLECQSAASAAVRECLLKTFKREGVEKGVALRQTLAKKFRPKKGPPLVHDILAFSTESPKMLDQLNLWSEVSGWVSFWEVPADGDDKVSPVEDLEVEKQTGMDVEGEPGTQSAELPPEPAEATEADAKYMEDVTTVLRSDQDEPALSSDGVCLFRLKNLAKSPHVTQILLDATGPFWKLHRRMLEAGCEVNPEWSPVKALFVPITQMSELQALADRGFEVSKQEHILALQSDYGLMTEALRSICWKFRPEIKQVDGPCPERPSPGDDPADLEDLEDIDELVVIELGMLRTPSDHFYPSLPTSSTAQSSRSRARDTCAEAPKHCREMEDFDVKDLESHQEDVGPTVLDIEWFEEPLGEPVPSQWGPVHLFDLCLWFGYVETAWALALGGVPRCTVELHHLGALPDARDAESPDVWEQLYCRCHGWATCSCCCWGFAVGNGIWMKDWEAPLHSAADAAKKAAKMPLVRCILDLSSRNAVLPFAMSEAAAARLLDIAILLGNVQAATNLAKTCQARPLRRLKGRELYAEPSTVFAALCAGADFQGLNWQRWGILELPLLRVVALDLEPEQWQRLKQFFPQEENKWPSQEMELGRMFLSGEPQNRWVCVRKIQNALRGGWDLNHVNTWIELEEFSASLLDLAILCGQSDCARALALAGVELNASCLDWCRRACYGRNPGDVCLYFDADHPEEDAYLHDCLAKDCKSAASAAARASRTKSFQREGVEKGIALYQTLAKKFHPRGVPMALVRDILAFSMETPKILDQLYLWEEVSGWIPSLEVTADGDGKASPVDDLDVEETGMDVDAERGTPLAELPPEPAEATEADAKFMEDVTTVLRSDRNEPVLSYELSKKEHILALQSDQDLIAEALRFLAHRIDRELQKRASPGDDPADLEELADIDDALPQSFRSLVTADEPKRCRGMAAMEDFDVKDLVIYKEDGGPTVLGVEWFRVLKALFEGHKERLGELVPSPWGEVHLFDLCLLFGQVETAWALALGGVKGCILQNYHLEGLPDARNAAPIVPPCFCTCTKTCSLCCWGFPLQNGVWMKDRDSPLDATADAARRAAEMPLVKSLLKIFSRHETLPFAMSEAAAVRLLDIAILCGNVEAAVSLAKICQARPLRRWRGHELRDSKLSTIIISAALFAGADFQGLHVQVPPGVDVPFLRFVALAFGPEQWQQLGQFLITEKNQWPSCDATVGWIFLNQEIGEFGLMRPRISMQRIQNASRAGWDLKHVVSSFFWGAAVHFASLLDLAILFGQRDCAEALGSAGVQLMECLDVHRWALGGVSYHYPFPTGSALECQSAASAAATASLKMSFKREGVEKGIALRQTLTKKFRPRGVPMALVRHILGFSTEAPKILDQLDLWDDVKGWMPCWEALADGDGKVSSMTLETDEQPCADVDAEPSTPLADLPPEPAEPSEADAKFMEDVTTVLRWDQNPPALSSDGTCLFRLKNLATSPHVTQLLLDATGPLAELHRRVLEAGCEVDPEWNPVKALFRPTTEVDMVEWQVSLIERGYELSREDHILALQTDQDLITEALRSICSRYRPKLGQGGPCRERASPGDDPADLEDVADMDDAQLHCIRAVSSESQATAIDLAESEEKEALSELVPSQWGPVHLFDLCLWFDHTDTALALARGGVEGCILQSYHLSDLPDGWDRQAIFWYGCHCMRWDTCSGCCWGFPVENGIWMKDWDVHLEDAADAAWEACENRLVGVALYYLSWDHQLPFALSDKTAARLLDIAILCGKDEAAANLAKLYSARPLRRWRGHELLDGTRDPCCRWKLYTISAALWAGADFHDLHVHWDDTTEVPFLRAAPLDFDLELWQRMEEFLPPDEDQWPTYDIRNMAELFFSDGPSEDDEEDEDNEHDEDDEDEEDYEHEEDDEYEEDYEEYEYDEDTEYDEDDENDEDEDDDDEDDNIYNSVSKHRVQNALWAGWDLKSIWTQIKPQDDDEPVFSASLLDVAILCGQSDCAKVLASAGVKRSLCSLYWCRQACHESLEFHTDDCGPLRRATAIECKAAASAAALVFLTKSYQKQGEENGIAVYQVLIAKCHPSAFPMALVHDILALSMDTPKIVDQLDLWDDVKGWIPPNVSNSRSVAGADEEPAVDLEEEEEDPTDYEVSAYHREAELLLEMQQEHLLTIRLNRQALEARRVAEFRMVRSASLPNSILDTSIPSRLAKSPEPSKQAAVPRSEPCLLQKLEASPNSAGAVLGSSRSNGANISASGSPPRDFVQPKEEAKEPSPCSCQALSPAPSLEAATADRPDLVGAGPADSPMDFDTRCQGSSPSRAAAGRLPPLAGVEKPPERGTIGLVGDLSPSRRPEMDTQQFQAQAPQARPEAETPQMEVSETLDARLKEQMQRLLQQQSAKEEVRWRPQALQLEEENTQAEDAWKEQRQLLEAQLAQAVAERDRMIEATNELRADVRRLTTRKNSREVSIAAGAHLSQPGPQHVQPVQPMQPVQPVPVQPVPVQPVQRVQLPSPGPLPAAVMRQALEEGGRERRGSDRSDRFGAMGSAASSSPENPGYSAEPPAPEAPRFTLSLPIPAAGTPGAVHVRSRPEVEVPGSASLSRSPSPPGWPPPSPETVHSEPYGCPPMPPPRPVAAWSPENPTVAPMSAATVPSPDGDASPAAIRVRDALKMLSPRRCKSTSPNRIR
eukprot:s45_g28.t1